jgi:peptide/nickel transport system ATP-binding protein
MTRPVLTIDNLTVSLPSGSDRQNAVTSLSLTVNPGEIVCVVGESGSGKSVTAQAVMGLLPKRQLTVTGGRILLQDEDTVTATPDRLRALRGTTMSMIFQEPMTALNPVMKVGDQIAEVLDIHTSLSSSQQMDKVREIMEAVRLPDVKQLVNSYPHQLSGGQRQRVMIAQALILDPSLLIADEPTTALDVTTQAQILKLIREMQGRKGTGVLFITHDFGVVADIADRVAVMQHGKLVETGTAREVLTNPQEPYTKMLIASVPTMTPPKRIAKTGDLALSTKALMKTFGAKSFFRPNARVVSAASWASRARASPRWRAALPVSLIRRPARSRSAILMWLACRSGCCDRTARKSRLSSRIPTVRSIPAVRSAPRSLKAL